MLSQLRRGESQSQGVSRVTLFPKALEERPSSILPVSSDAGGPMVPGLSTSDCVCLRMAFCVRASLLL